MNKKKTPTCQMSYVRKEIDMYSNYNFKKGLENQMKLKGITSSKKLSELTGYPASTISNYRCEKANPTLHVLADFADYFEISIDELILRERVSE